MDRRWMTGRAAALVFCSGAIWLAGCGSDGAPASDAPSEGDEATDVGGPVEIFSWWTSGGEREALDALLEIHEKRVPDADVRNSALEYRDKAREQLTRRLQDGTPPDLFQALAGADLRSWVLTNGVDADASHVESLTDLAEAFDFERVFSSEVLSAASFDGELYGVPMNVHRLNTLFYDKRKFAELGLEIPKTLDELLELCRRVEGDDDIQAASPTGRMACIGLGNKHAWPLSELTFEVIFPAVAGPHYYERYFRGEERGDAEPVIEALDVALELYCGGRPEPACGARGWFNADVDVISWDEGVRKLATGTVLMATMGDWAKGLLESEAGGGLVADVDFGVGPFPGTEGAFVFATDTFAMPLGAKNRDGARSLLATVASFRAQIEFNRLKGSIPARMDVPREEFDRVTRETMAAFDESARVPALSALLSSELQALIASELKASFQKGKTEIILNFLRANYRSFRRR